MRIPFKCDLGTFTVPTSYDDLTMKDFETLRSLDTGHDVLTLKQTQDKSSNIIASLTGLEFEQIKKIDVTAIIGCLSFLNTPVMNGLLASNKLGVISLPDDLGTLSWQQLILGRKALAEGDYKELLSIYLMTSLGNDINDDDNYEEFMKSTRSFVDAQRLTDAYSLALFIIDQINTIVKRDNDMLTSKPTAEQVQAGVSNFNVLGEYNTARMIAKTFNCKPVDVYKWSYNDVFLELLHNDIDSKFQKRYHEIMNSKRK